MNLPSRGYRPGGRRPVAERAVWPLCVVPNPPLFDHNLCLLQRIKNLSVQAFVPQIPVEAFAVTVLPRTAGFDVHRSRSHFRQPLPQFPPRRTQIRCPSECSPRCPGTTSHPPPFRSLRTSPASLPRGSPSTPACIHRSVSAFGWFFHRAFWRSRSRSSTRDSAVPVATVHNFHRSTTTFFVGRCFCGTFSPSRRQMRCTRSLPTCQPASCNSAVILR